MKAHGVAVFFALSDGKVVTIIFKYCPYKYMTFSYMSCSLVRHVLYMSKLFHAKSETSDVLCLLNADRYT